MDIETITIECSRTEEAPSDFRFSSLSTSDVLIILRSQFRLLDLRARRGLSITRGDLLRVSSFLRDVLEEEATA
jgi:hypothetical protein